MCLDPRSIAGQLSEADCDCSQVIGTCLTGDPIITQPYDQGETWNVRHWLLSLKADPRYQCTQVSIAMTYKKDGVMRGGLNNNNYRRLLPNGGPGPLVSDRLATISQQGERNE